MTKKSCKTSNLRSWSKRIFSIKLLKPWINHQNNCWFPVDVPKLRYDNWLRLTEEDAGRQQAHVWRAQQQVAARRWQQKRHTEDLHGVTGIGPTAHHQQQPVEQTKTWEQKQHKERINKEKLSVKESSDVGLFWIYSTVTVAARLTVIIQSNAELNSFTIMYPRFEYVAMLLLLFSQQNINNTFVPHLFHQMFYWCLSKNYSKRQQHHQTLHYLLPLLLAGTLIFSVHQHRVWCSMSSCRKLFHLKSSKKTHKTRSSDRRFEEYLRYYKSFRPFCSFCCYISSHKLSINEMKWVRWVFHYFVLCEFEPRKPKSSPKI